ncbi:MAG: corrinoid protein [Verrucomicrobiales bacterium]|jgi:methanogenic corrinoid protein MtbC1|nr:corrinoid protein [Verrucomicrobiales bacterium]
MSNSINNEETQLHAALADDVVAMDETNSVGHANEIVARQFDAYTAIDQGLVEGMNRVGKLFEQEEYFIPELLLSSDAMYAALDVLKPHIRRADGDQKPKVVFGVVEGDTHDIGKNLVKIMADSSGYEVIDLGRDVPPQKFVDEAVAVGASCIAISTLMTTTMDAMAEVVTILQKLKLREKFKVIVGGGPISPAFAEKIGADGYAPSAPTAVKLLNKLLAPPASA